MKRMLLTAAIILCAASVARADAKFGAMDTDKNGSVDWEEFQKAYPQMRKPAFDSIDANGDGTISHEEWDGFRSRHGEGGKGMGGMGSGGQMPPAGMDGKMPPKGMGGMPVIEAPGKASPGSTPLVAPPKQ